MAELVLVRSHATSAGLVPFCRALLVRVLQLVMGAAGSPDSSDAPIQETSLRSNRSSLVLGLRAKLGEDSFGYRSNYF